MRILLVRYHDGSQLNTRLPKSLNRIRGVMPPLGLLSVAAYLEKFGHNVKIIDAVAEGLNDEDFKYLVRKYNPDICGVTSMLENYFGACQACKIAKHYGATTVIGGPGLEIYPKEMIDKDYIDYGVVGEGEETFLQLVKAIECLDHAKIMNIAGVSHKISGKIVSGSPQIIGDLDLLPRPAYHLIDIANYSSLINDYPVITYMMGRGCPFQCSFCVKQETDKYIRFHSPKRVVDDLEYLVGKYKLKEFMFYDDTFTLSIKQIREFCEGILKRGVKVKFEAPTRIDNIVTSEGMDLLRHLKKAGCYRLRLGVESGDPAILRSMNKKINLSDVELAFKRCREIGIQTFAYFMIGYLGESQSTFENTINFAIKLNPNYAMFTIATPYPKTKLYEESLRAGIVPSDYWKDFIEGRISERIPYLASGVENLVKNAYRRFYFRPQYLMKSIVNLRSRQHIKNAIDGFLGLLLFNNN